MLAEAAAILSAIRNTGWLTRRAQSILKRMRPPETRVFDTSWWFFDKNPTTHQQEPHSGEARLSRVGLRDAVQMRSIRLRERTDPTREVSRPYRASGHLRGNILVLCWEADNRPMMFGAMVLAVNIDRDQMTGFTVYFNPDENRIERLPIWFRPAPVAV